MSSAEVNIGPQRCLNEERRVFLPFQVDAGAAFEMCEVATVRDLVDNRQINRLITNESGVVTRELRRDFALLPRSYQTISTTLTHLFLKEGNEANPSDFFRAKLEETFPGMISEDEVELIVSDTSERFEFTKIVNDQYIVLSDRLCPAIKADPVFGYTMLKLFISSSLETTNDGSKKYPEVLPFLFAARLRQDPTVESPAEILLKQAESGLFDTLIANDLLESLAVPSVEPEHNPHILAMLKLVKQVSEETPLDILQTRLAQVIDAWPYAANKEYQQSRTFLVAKFKQEVRLVKDYSELLGYTMPEHQKTIDHLRHNFYDLAKASTPRTVGGVALENPKLSKRMLRRPKVPPIEATSIEAVVQKEPSPITVATPEGNGTYVFSDEKEKVDAMITDFVSSYKGTPGLKENIKSMVRFLEMADFSNVISGIKRYHGRVTIGTVRAPVYGLKPSDAPGVSVNSKTARHMRVLFVRNEGTIGLLALVERSKVNTVERKLSLNDS